MITNTSDADSEASDGTTLPGATTHSVLWTRYPAWIVLLVGLLFRILFDG